MSGVKELFTYSVYDKSVDWNEVVGCQKCRYINKRCYKVRKSEPSISIGTCTVSYGRNPKDVIICPHRLLERNQIFIDCLHLLTCHEPGNEIHVVPEVGIPGGNVDFFLVSCDKNRKVKDFVGIELQTMDTTGTVWPDRQELLGKLGFDVQSVGETGSYGMNWKMTAKTILVQLHHKIETFEGLNKHFVLIVQDCLLDYIKREFTFDHVSKNASLGDSAHFHAYELNQTEQGFRLSLKERRSTDKEGISRLLGLKANANIKFEQIAEILEAKISDNTVLHLR